jgi:galactose oxidase
MHLLTDTVNAFAQGHGMFCPGTSSLADGRILITGGLTEQKATIYNPFTDTWTATTEMNVPRGYQSQMTLANGQVFVYGGSWSAYIGGKFAEVYDPAAATWIPKPGIKAEGSICTNDRGGFYRSDNHFWLYQAPDGALLHVGPARMMHRIDLTGNGSVTEIG